MVVKLVYTFVLGHNHEMDIVHEKKPGRNLEVSEAEGW